MNYIDPEFEPAEPEEPEEQWWVDPPRLTGFESTQKPEHVIVAFLDSLDV